MGRLSTSRQQVLYHGFRAINHRILERASAELIFCVDAGDLCKGIHTRLILLVNGPHQQLTRERLVAVSGMRGCQRQRMRRNEAGRYRVSLTSGSCEPLHGLRALLGTPFRKQSGQSESGLRM